ncbi:hypothetical protein M431DRAFT_510967 [Trichoderma harzianum CBS 226.95]|uniref:Uncharacterized protein n=1 Tax=Trichoderma harzianum CBS 226.95 TaxID=983964 RepID=A0A2T4A433_TRIHA|nr:hypothetical protein M431DRAFT_510967 [Trichoderma harzianum CBS 226.95]PTB51819.1 hypothetical protein M431DRAFT_510967 [Trichoderma harzianum CBS 226.95]
MYLYIKPFVQDILEECKGRTVGADVARASPSFQRLLQKIHMTALGIARAASEQIDRHEHILSGI